MAVARPEGWGRFDYVIAGGGSAGCVLANRLREDPSARVCLIEAGPRDRSPLIHIPAALFAITKHKTRNWRFSTAPLSSVATAPGHPLVKGNLLPAITSPVDK